MRYKAISFVALLATLTLSSLSAPAQGPDLDFLNHNEPILMRITAIPTRDIGMIAFSVPQLRLSGPSSRTSPGTSTWPPARAALSFPYAPPNWQGAHLGGLFFQAGESRDAKGHR
jgi:hypothetical protein